MNSILAALVGGIGSGATSYGQNRMREEEQQRTAQQRMAEIERNRQLQMEQRKMQLEDAALKRTQDRAAGVASIKALFPEFQAPEGDFDAQVALKGMLDREASKRLATMEAGRNSRNEASLEGRLENTERLIDGRLRGIEMGINARRDVDAALADLRRAQAESERRGDTSPDKSVETKIRDLAIQFQQGKMDSDGYPMKGFEPMDAAAARAKAEQIVRGAMGLPAPQGAAPAAPTARPVNRMATGDAEMAEMQAAQQSIAAIRGNPSMSSQEKQDRIDFINEKLRERIGAIRSGR